MAGSWQPPDYKLEVTCKYIVIRIYSPLCRQESMAVIIEGRKVTYDCFPYYLRVTIPQCFANHVVERFYDEILGFYTLKFTRSHYNVAEFDARAVYNELVESIKAVCRVGNQLVFVPVHPVAKAHYGFLNMYSGRFGLYCREFPDVIELTDPDNTKLDDRRVLRLLDEEQKWNEDHYIADFMENDHIVSLYSYVPPWLSQNSQVLTEYEQRFLWKIRIYDCFQRGLHNHQWNFGELQLVDVLLAYCYNKRSTEGVNTVVSAWTISKLSSTLSWFEVFDSLKDVLLAFYKRSLTYPLYRNWDFTKKIHSDLASLLRSGVTNIIRALIEVQELFEITDNYYILNMLYINNMIHFCKHFPIERLTQLAAKIERTLISKIDVHEDLLILEAMALLVAEEEEGVQMSLPRPLMPDAGRETEESSSSSEEESESDADSVN